MTALAVLWGEPAAFVADTTRAGSSRRGLLAAGFGVAASVAILAAWKGSHPLPGPASTPVVVLMDTAAERGVYCSATAARGGTNADDLNDLLSDLPAEFRKETISSTWDRETALLAMHPSVVLIHRSSLFHSLNKEFELGYPPLSDPTAQHRFELLYRTADDKLQSFLGFVGTYLPRGLGALSGWREDML